MSINVSHNLVDSFASVSRSRRTYGALRAFTLLSYLTILFYLLLQGADPSTTFSAVLITTSSIVPILIWYSLPDRGLPIFPIFAIPFIWCYATPLVIGHKVVDLYAPSEHLYAGYSIASFLAISTIAWRLTLNVRQNRSQFCYRFLKHQYKPILFVVIVSSLLFHLAQQLHLISIPFGFHVIMQTGIEVAMSLAVFILGYMWGAKKLNTEERVVFFTCLVATCYAQALSFILFAPVAKLVILIAAITLGAKRFPSALALVLLSLFILLHFGKYEMRSKYWYGDSAGQTFSFFQVPSLYFEWYTHSVNYLLKEHDDSPPEIIRAHGSNTLDRRFTERLSLMHMFLEVQKRAGTDVPFFYGSTYSVIPRSLIPRIFNPRKASPHEAMYSINIEYGHQTRDNTRTTHKAWGLLAEAWANFGAFGLALLGIIMGATLGLLTVYTRNYPLLSFRGCFAALLCTATIPANSTTLAILISSILHSVIILSVIALIWMKPRPKDELS